MKPFSVQRIAIATLVATLLSIRGKRKKSLSTNGAITAFVVGFSSIVCGNRGFLLLIFYMSGTMVTKLRCHEKEGKDGDAYASSIRSPYQVLACSGVAVYFALVHALYFGEEVSIDFTESPIESSIACSIIAHYCTCCGDTFASEIGTV